MIACSQTKDMFDLNKDKLAADTVEAREDIVKYYAKHPKSLFFWSHSSGKDSQCGLIRLRQLVPDEKIIVVHADLGDEVEHDGVQDHIRKYTPPNIPIYVIRNELRSFLDGVLKRGKWFSSQARYCTSDYKTSQMKLI